MDSGKPWFSPKKEEVEGGDGQAHRGGCFGTVYFSYFHYSGISRFQIYNAAFSEAFLPQFPKVEKASTEEVDAAHKQYMAALASLYLKHNTDENVSLVIT